MRHYDNFMGGKFAPSQGAGRITVTNPATGHAICTVPDSAPADVEAAIAKDRAFFGM